jgi:membrane dipeptidase
MNNECNNGLIIADTHCDTTVALMDAGINIFSNKLHVDIERLRQYKGYVQFFAACVNPYYGREYAVKNIFRAIDTFYSQAGIYRNYIELCRNLGEIENALEQKKVAAILAVEGGDILQGDLAMLRILYRLGVRCMTLTWNYRNEIADGILDNETCGGLTSFGKSVIKEMNKLGMIVDLSHISEKGFWDAIEVSGAPVILSHSNAKRLCGHVRNVSDSQLMAVKENGGMVCVNFYPDFLHDTGKAGIPDIIRHIEYLSGLVGVDYIGIGSDFDGVDKLPEGVMGVQDTGKVFNELAKLKYSQEAMEKIAYKNVLRIIEKVCGCCSC